MTTFGIGGRGNRTAPLGNVSQQSVGSSNVTTATRPETVVGESSSTVNDGLVTSRTITPALSVIGAIALGERLPGIFTNISPLIFPPKKIYEQDTLNLAEFKINSNSEFEPISKNGISIYRPEILSVLSFQPIDGPGSLSPETASGGAPNQLMKANYQATEIRAKTLQKLIQDIRRKPEYRVPMDAVKNLFSSKMNNTKTALDYFSSVLNKVEIVKTSLDPKKIPLSSYNTTTYLSLIDFYDRKMQFSKNKFSIFSDTKILNQLTSDLRNILEGYSFSLLNTTDTDRVNDYSPVKIDRTYTQTNGFTFSISSLRSLERTVIAAYKPDFFNQFLNSLPSSPDDKIKLLTHILSKELRVSRQLGKTDVARTLLSSYGQVDNSNPFDNICGTVGDTIFDEPEGTNSIASLTYVKGSNDETVLPFESLYVDSEIDHKTFIPGSAYFGDSILDISQTGFNIQPFIDFTTKYSSTISLASSTIKTLLDVENNQISPDGLYDYFLLSLLESSSGLVNQAGINKSQAICLGLFKLANTNTDLKNLLFEYLLLLGLMSNSSEDRKLIFQRLAYEVSTIQNFTHAAITKFDNPSLLEGTNTLRPYIENIAKKIEDKVYALLNPNNFKTIRTDGVVKLTPSFGASVLGREVSGPLATISSAGVLRTLPIASRSVLASDGEYILVSTSGEIKETLINAATTIGSSSTNVCKEFVDLCVKLDQMTSIAGNATYLNPDATGRTRFNFFSTSTQMLLVFEIMSSLANKYSSCSFSKASSAAKVNILINTKVTSNISQIIRDIVVSKTNDFRINPNLSAGILSGLAASVLANETPRAGSSDSFTITPVNIFRPSQLVPVTGSGGGFFSANANLSSIISNPTIVAAFAQQNEHKRTLVGNREKLKGENISILNILHIFETINRKLTSIKEMAISSFSLVSLTSFLSSTGLTLTDLALIKNPSQIRTSSWIYDRYDDKLSDTSLFDSGDVGLGFLATDRISQVEINAMNSMLAQPNFSYGSLADQFVKIVSVGLPAGFSKNISDRISKQSISDTNFNNKQFDVISINVYKRDARYDDLVFKPQKFIFDLSLFPTKNFLPSIFDGLNQNYSTILRTCKFKDYEILTNKKNADLASLTLDEKYNFLSLTQRSDLVENHFKSQMFDLYTRLLMGIRIDEETFSNIDYSKINVQDDIISSLIINYLKTARKKKIPTQSLSQLLLNPIVDQETKDIIRLLSYGNIMFQADFVKKRILEPKLFDRVFHIPVDIRNFEIDVETTISTEAGKQMYKKNQVQNQIITKDKKIFLTKNDRNEASFEDIFVVVESNLRNN